MISLAQARQIIMSLSPLRTESLECWQALGRVSAARVPAVSDCPGMSASLKDGYAVRSRDVSVAAPDSPVVLECVETVVAGQETSVMLEAGQAVRIMTGGPIPAGADAVLSSEFARQEGKQVLAFADASPGRNILPRGADVRAGDFVVCPGDVMTPARIGLVTAAGVGRIQVFRRPRVLVAATGSELVPPGRPVPPGKIAASNLAMLLAELQKIGIRADSMLVRDDLDGLCDRLGPVLEKYDLVLTCGGVLDGDKDFTMRAMRELGVQSLFQRVRIGPGKGACLGRHGECLVLNLPGGPPSNHVAYLLLGRPLIDRLAGVADPFARWEPVRLAEPLQGQKGWTQLIYGRLENGKNGRWFIPLSLAGSRLQAMARADGLAELGEERESLAQGSMAKIWKTG